MKKPNFKKPNFNVGDHVYIIDEHLVMPGARGVIQARGYFDGDAVVTGGRRVRYKGWVYSVSCCGPEYACIEASLRPGINQEAALRIEQLEKEIEELEDEKDEIQNQINSIQQAAFSDHLNAADYAGADIGERPNR